MQNLLAPFNGDISLINYAAEKGIKEFYGQSKVEIIGGGRSAFNFPDISKSNLKKAINLMHDYNISFNYTLNSLSLANLEFNPLVQKKIISQLEYIQKIGVDSVTLSNPFIMQIVKKNFPNLKICASIISEIRNSEQVNFFESLGVKRIVLSKHINKNINGLKKIISKTNVEVQLIVNDPCLAYCPLRNYHNLINGFSSMDILNNKSHLSFCTLMCRKIFLETPEELSRASWIRPEDLAFYESLGVGSFKLVDRKESTPWIKNVLTAYCEREYDGNFADLCSYFSPIKGKGELDSNPELRLLASEDINSIEDIEKNKNNLRFKPFIDNKKIGEYTKRILNNSCTKEECNGCGLCKLAVDNAIYLDEEQRKKVLCNINLVLNKINSKEFWGVV